MYGFSSFSMASFEAERNELIVAVCGALSEAQAEVDAATIVLRQVAEESAGWTSAAIQSLRTGLDGLAGRAAGESLRIDQVRELW